MCEAVFEQYNVPALFLAKEATLNAFAAGRYVTAKAGYTYETDIH